MLGQHDFSSMIACYFETKLSIHIVPSFVSLEEYHRQYLQ
jgi:hypothetical protein